MCAFFKIFLLKCYNLFPNNFYMSCCLASLTLFYKSTNVTQPSLGNQPHPAFLGQPWTRPAAPCQSEPETSCGGGAWGSLCLCSTCDKFSVKAHKPLLENFRKLTWPQTSWWRIRVNLSYSVAQMNLCLHSCEPWAVVSPSVMLTLWSPWSNCSCHRHSHNCRVRCLEKTLSFPLVDHYRNTT